MATTGGERQVWSYVFLFYDQVGALLRRRLIDFDLVDDLLGNSTRQLWEKVGGPVVGEARERFDPRLYEHFEFLYDEMNRRAERKSGRLSYVVPVQPAFATRETSAIDASRKV
jgi:hypothetical protein